MFGDMLNDLSLFSTEKKDKELKWILYIIFIWLIHS